MNIKIPRWSALPEKVFYIYAITAGPIWAKNLTAFMLWFLSFAMIFMIMLWKSSKDEMTNEVFVFADEAKPGWHVPLTRDRHWIYHVLTAATIVVLAAMHWWWTGALYLIASLGWWAFVEDVKDTLDKPKEEETEG